MNLNYSVAISLKFGDFFLMWLLRLRFCYVIGQAAWTVYFGTLD